MSIEDKLYRFLKIYKKSPFVVKLTLGKIYKLFPKKLRYGQFYYLYLKRIKNFNKNQTSTFLSQQLELANENLSYYRDIKHENLSEFPIINKHLINDNFESFVNHNNTNRIKTNTGGSSGNPFEFYIEKGVSRPKEKAHFDWYWGLFGYEPGDKILMIRGESLSDGRLYEYQPIENKLAISCYLLNTYNIDKVLLKINKFNPNFIHAYPSALKNFINLVAKAQLSLTIDIKTIFLGSEGLYSADRELFATYFKAKIAHWYGQSERLTHAGNCPFSNNLHIFPFYGFVELVDEQDKVITSPEAKGRIVATGFDNAVMPLIRYDTGDEAEYAKETECLCGFKGKSFRIIHGRKQDYLYLNDFTKVSLTAFIFGQHFDEFSSINDIQLEQNTAGKLIIRLVLKENHILNREKFIEKLRMSVQKKITISIQIEESITKTNRGKHVFLIQNIKSD